MRKSLSLPAPRQFGLPRLTVPLALGLVGLNASWASDIVITPLKEGDADLPLAPWVREGDPKWADVAPHFTLGENNSKSSARGWVAVSDRNIHLRVVVVDDIHVNERSDGSIWEGDCIQVGIDALGNGRPGHRMDGNDAALAFALTSKGPVSWAYYHGRPGGSGAMPQIQPTITRDDQAGTTTYDIPLPWAEFQVEPGLSPVLGIAVQVNDTDPGAEQTRLYYGQGASGKPDPGAFRKLRLGSSLLPVLAASVDQEFLWRIGDAGEIVVAVGGQPDLTLRVAMDEIREEMPLPATPIDGGVKRLAIRGIPRPLPPGPLPLEVSIVNAQGTVLLSRTANLTVGEQAFLRLNQRIDTLAAQPLDPLFTRHLRTAQGVANLEWQVAQWELDHATHLAENAVGYARQMLEGLDGDAASWDAYLDRRRKLVLGFLAPWDRTLQYYMVSLPKGWDREKTYPMIVFLHGAGTSHVAAEVVASLLSGSESKPVPARFEGDLNTIYIEPYGRGRHGYHGIVERDILLAVDDAIKTFKVDPDRLYLTGFSMGGAGTWSVAAHTPDRWAAVCVSAGHARNIPTGIGIGRNYIGLPVRIWHGEDDLAIRSNSATVMAEELRAFGIEPNLVIQPGVGHDYYGYPQESESLAWLVSHTRTRPNHFAFTAETNEFLGRNGVTLARDPSVSFNPWFECRIDGGTVRLSSQGTPTLTVQLGKDGLGFEDRVTVLHNDQKVYEGPAVTIQINTSDGKVTEDPAQISRK